MSVTANNLVLISCEDIDEPVWIAEMEQTAYSALALLNIKNWELSLVFCNDTLIRELNARYRDKDEATDVLSFSQDADISQSETGPDGRIIAGDIIISTDTVSRNADSAGITLQTELKRLIVHGILHLSGLDHHEEDESMLIQQEEILKTILESKAPEAFMNQSKEGGSE